MAQILAEILNDHRNYTTLLTLLQDDIDKLQHSENPDFIRLYDIMNYMSNYPDVTHHLVEEIIFATLAEKSADAIPQIKLLSNEHQELVKLSLSLKEKLHHVTSGSIVSKDALIKTANEYHELLTNHICLEEEQILPIVENTFTAEDWSLIDKQIDKAEDPLFGDVVQEQFSDLYKRITLSKSELT